MQIAYLSRRAFFRLLTVYGTFILLVLALTLPLVITASHELEDSIVRSFAKEIEQNVVRFDAQMNSFSSILQRIVREDDYQLIFGDFEGSPAYNPLTLNSARRHLSDVANSFDSVNDVAILSDNGLILTRDRSYTARNNLNKLFYGRDFEISGADSLETFEAIIEKGVPFCAAAHSENWGRYDALVLPFPLCSISMLRIADAFISVNLPYVLGEIAPPVFYESGVIALKSAGSDQILYSTGEGGDEAITLSAVSALGVRFVLSAPRSAVFSHIQPLIRTIKLSLCGLLIGGIAIAIFFAWRNHLPMRRLSGMARSLTGADVGESKDSYEYVSNLLSQMSQKLRISSEQLDAQRQQIQNNLLEKALLGNVASRLNYQAFETLMPDFPSTYSIAMVMLRREKAKDSIDEMLSHQLRMEEMISTQFDRPIYHLNMSGAMFILVLPQEVDSKSAMERFCAAYARVYQMPVKVFLSDMFSGVDGLREAYSQVKRLQHMSINNGGSKPETVYSSASFEAHEWNMRLDYTVFQQLYEALTIAEKDNAIASLRRLYMMLPDQNDAPNDTAASTYNKTLDFTQSVMLRVKRENFDVLRSVKLYAPDPAQSLTSYFVVLEDYIKELCDTLAAARKKPSSIEDEVIAYIDQNVTNADLCAQSITSRFSLSESALQAILHERRNSTLANYIEKKRMEVARRLLSKSDLTVQQVAEQSGFALYNTFYKAVRRQWGCSPSEYRTRYARFDELDQ